MLVYQHPGYQANSIIVNRIDVITTRLNAETSKPIGDICCHCVADMLLRLTILYSWIGIKFHIPPHLEVFNLEHEFIVKSKP